MWRLCGDPRSLLSQGRRARSLLHEICCFVKDLALSDLAQGECRAGVGGGDEAGAQQRAAHVGDIVRDLAALEAGGDGLDAERLRRLGSPNTPCVADDGILGRDSSWEASEAFDQVVLLS